MMIIPTPKGVPDERFLAHRLKSTSIAGVTGGLVAVGLWAYQHYANDVWRWDLFAVAATIAGVKVAAMLWYRFTD
jgi:hypothetical protein